MGELYAARYSWSGADWIRDVAPALYALDRLHTHIRARPARWLAGSAPNALSERLQLPPECRDSAARPSARALLACAESAWTRGEAIHAAAALPLYLRDNVALTTAERQTPAASAA